MDCSALLLGLVFCENVRDQKRQILLELFHRTFGVTGHVLDWVSSCLSGHTQFVHYIRCHGCTALGTGCTPLLQCLGRLSLPPSVGQ